MDEKPTTVQKREYRTAIFEGERILLSVDAVENKYIVSGKGAWKLCQECLQRDLVSNTNWLSRENGTGYFTISCKEFEQHFPKLAKAQASHLSVV